MTQLNCAIIGCGRIGCGFDDVPSKIIRTHASAYYKNPKTKLIALCDIDKTKLKKYGEKYNVSGLYTKSSDLFSNEDIDCLSICTLADSHLNLVKEAVMNGVKGIFLEKPMSNTLFNAKQIIEFCRKKDVKLLIDHKRRFDPFYQSIRNLLIQKKLGTIELINVYYGAGISNTGSHLFDLLRFFFGEIKSVEASLSKNKSYNPNDPNIDVRLNFKQNLTCQIQALDYNPYGLFEMDVFGIDGRMRLDLGKNKIEYFKVEDNKFFVYRELHSSKINVKKSNPSPLLLAIDNLVNSIEKIEEPKCSGLDGYKSLELIISCIQSSRKHKKIFLPLKNNDYKISSK